MLFDTNVIKFKLMESEMCKRTHTDSDVCITEEEKTKRENTQQKQYHSHKSENKKKKKKKKQTIIPRALSMFYLVHSLDSTSTLCTCPPVHEIIYYNYCPERKIATFWYCDQWAHKKENKQQECE